MGFFEKIKAGLTRTKENIGHSFDQLFAGELNDDFYDELEETLILGDMGVDTTMKAVEELRRRVKAEKIKDMEGARACLRQVLTDMLQVGEPELRLDTAPSVALFIGVNGVGKTTTIGKLSARMKGEGRRVLMAAADTFRAAAADQLEIWSERSGVELVRQYEGADPAAVVFDALTAAKARSADVVLIDTAGRLHNKQYLMNELNKISRVVDRELPGCDRETLLVLDAATGQNAVNQAREFQSAAGITGIVLTKLDGTPKGGVVLPIMQDLGLPVKFIGVGEQVDDLQPFDPDAFANALFDNERDDTPVFAEDRAAAQLEEQRQEEEVLQEQEQAGEDALEGEELFQQLEERPLTEESLLSDIDAMLEESRPEEPQEELEEPQPEKKKRRFWPFGRKRDEE